MSFEIDIDTGLRLFWGLLALFVLVKLATAVRVVPTKSACVVERLGKYRATLGPGFHTLLPFLDKVAHVRDLKEMVIDVPPTVSPLLGLTPEIVGAVR